ncbi:MAG: 23S rRNA (adenine(2030)-N(6))-methyltransferase RlmJ [Micavibrio aeruginosavorus]|uniref:Ribosomal RNA large subunit methyltransferase J n=1 Tax=Micavibrio aeruginosavorus TaxID=349221 RepID=A0A7T5R465_9BACT|nr:MAG: 23S rRNA (adenine(2030)-N(6))-methyltransferase RlmJ [Micavibrio aeruginosavorus]
MNYRHIYHAGNFADVFKHIVLMRLLDHLKHKEKPFFLLDTHAGIGLYDLDSEQAQKTGEASDGILRLQNAKVRQSAVQAYLDMVAEFKGLYPGSPKIMQRLMRESDRLVVNELHPDDREILRAAISRDPCVRVEGMDGYLALKALLPPLEKRGLVLVDPPFEVADEFSRMVKGLQNAHERWATGIYAFWYPIKCRRAVQGYHEALHKTGIRKIVAADFYLRAPADPELLNGCGMVLVNPPWTLATELNTIMGELVPLLADKTGSYYWTQIAGE